MKKKWLAIGASIGFAICAGILIFRSSDEKKGEAIASPLTKPTSYFFPIEVVGFSSANIPLVSIEIEEKRFCVILDLGCSGGASLVSPYVESLREKTFVSSDVKSGFRGNQYSITAYQIPSLKVGGVEFSDVILREQSNDLNEESHLIKDGNLEVCESVGAIGWTLFPTTNLFLDLGNSSVAVCDSFETFLSQGRSTEAFVKTRLVLEQGMIEIDAETDRGSLRCLLDTGTTINFIRVENPEGLSPEEIAGNAANKTEFQVFQIGGMNFGKQEFRHLPINAPIPVEAILGMEFFMKHRVFVDFQEGWVYIASVNEE